MIRNEIFSRFVKEHPNWETEANVSQPNDNTYKLIPRRNFTNTINVKTGEIFGHDEGYRSVILIKNIACLFFVRPLQIVTKTLWHLTIIGPLVRELDKLHRKMQTFDQFKEKMLDSFSDIVRTPIYGVALLAVHAGGIFCGIFYPNSLFYSRDLIGHLERSLLRKEILAKDDEDVGFFAYNSMTPCFHPISHLMATRDTNLEKLEIYTTINEFLKNPEFAQTSR